MEKNWEKKVTEIILASIEEGKKIEITSDGECVYVKNINLDNGLWVSKAINKKDGKCNGFVTNFACF
jgi:hypothetical protein